MRIERRYTKAGQSPYAAIAFRLATSEIRNPDGSVVFRLDDIEVPDAWSQVAADVLAQKYFRKAGVPARLKKVEENDVPSFLWRSVPDEAALAALPEDERYGSEIDRAKQVFDRLAGCLDLLGLEGRLFRLRGRRAGLLRRAALHARPPDGRAELAAMVQHRPALGLWHRRPGQGHYYVDHKTGKLTKSKSAYEHPQPHACFIQSVARRPRQRGRHHGPVGARGAPVQIRLRHRLQLLRAARRRREALGRRQLLRPDVASSRSATAPPAPSSRAAPRAAPPRWSSSTSTTPTSRTTSTGR